MRTLRLARLAADAEVLLIRREIHGYVNRAVYGAVAALFGVGALILLHVLAYMALVQFAHMKPFFATLILLGVDAVVTGICAAIATGEIADPIADEARRLRDQSMLQIKETLSMAAVLRPAGRMLGRKHIYGLVLAALTARFLGSSRA
jgi:hypothetical protein